MNEIKRVAVAILNWNGRHWLEKFLPGVIENSTESLAEIIVIDNASTDDSFTFLKERYPALTLICLSENKGYTGGYNEGLAGLNHEYFVLLNSDIEVTPRWLEPIVRLMDGDQKIAACQPKILAYNNKESFEYAGASGGYIDWLGYPFCRGRIFDTLEKDNGQYDDAKKIFWATGACLFVRSSVFKELKGLDTRFFAHMEEIDLCWRMQNAGYDIWVEPLSKVYHVGGGTLQSDSPQKTYLNFRNNLYLIVKNEDFWRAYPIIVIRLFMDGLAGCKFLMQGKFAHVWAIIRAHFKFHFTNYHFLYDRKIRKKLPMVYSKSIVWQYFAKGKKRYTELK